MQVMPHTKMCAREQLNLPLPSEAGSQRLRRLECGRSAPCLVDHVDEAAVDATRVGAPGLQLLGHLVQRRPGAAIRIGHSLAVLGRVQRLRRQANGLRARRQARGLDVRKGPHEVVHRRLGGPVGQAPRGRPQRGRRARQNEQAAGPQEAARRVRGDGRGVQRRLHHGPQVRDHVGVRGRAHGEAPRHIHHRVQFRAREDALQGRHQLPSLVFRAALAIHAQHLRDLQLRREGVRAEGLPGPRTEDLAHLAAQLSPGAHDQHPACRGGHGDERRAQRWRSRRGWRSNVLSQSRRRQRTARGGRQKDP
mmetsp:Transcript_62164/g.202831  ORF Transcript_62164/g.202831 Transcript_62164/m.202831 type:complete len:307 (+) Transcript_62164:293-1213(+)